MVYTEINKVLTDRVVRTDELDRFADELIQFSQGTRVWLFFGKMGSGKTTLIKHICVRMGVKEWVTSPTFSIVNEYLAGNGSKLYHFDFYRVRDESEAFQIGAEEYFESGSYCFIEWPERIRSLLPLHCFVIDIRERTSSERTVKYALL